MVARLVKTSDAFSPTEREAVYRAIRTRRDVRSHFVSDAIPDEVLHRIIDAAHQAPSVGLSQPWRFIVIREAATRERVRNAFLEANAIASAAYEGDRAKRYNSLRLEGITSAPVNICVVCNESPVRGAGLGRMTMPETVRYSTVCAVQNLWLAARAEGLGVGWVSILEPDAVHSILGIPAGVSLIAYLCIGYVSAFAEEPDLSRAGWEMRLPLADVVDYERYRADSVP